MHMPLILAYNFIIDVAITTFKTVDEIFKTFKIQDIIIIITRASPKFGRLRYTYKEELATFLRIWWIPSGNRGNPISKFTLNPNGFLDFTATLQFALKWGSRHWYPPSIITTRINPETNHSLVAWSALPQPGIKPRFVAWEMMGIPLHHPADGI